MILNWKLLVSTCKVFVVFFVQEFGLGTCNLCKPCAGKSCTAVIWCSGNLVEEPVIWLGKSSTAVIIVTIYLKRYDQMCVRRKGAPLFNCLCTFNSYVLRDDLPPKLSTVKLEDSILRSLATARCE